MKEPYMLLLDTAQKESKVLNNKKGYRNQFIAGFKDLHAIFITARNLFIKKYNIS